VHNGTILPSAILKSFSKAALLSHSKTNCLTEILIPRAIQWAQKCNTKGPLAGVPVSLKDSVCVAGYDATIGYSRFAFDEVKEEDEAPLVRLLRDAGAVPFVKTNIPITLMCELPLFPSMLWLKWMQRSNRRMISGVAARTLTTLRSHQEARVVANPPFLPPEVHSSG
jgi:hypothetical protein